MKTLILFLLWFGLSGIGIAQTVVYNIHKDTVWTKDGNPYLLNSNIRIDSGVTLTIQSGTRVFGNKNVLITVFGKVKISGKKADSVYFSVNHPQPDFNNFGGIRIMSGASAEINYVRASYAKRFLSFEGTSYGEISNSYLDFNKTAINIDSQSTVYLRKTMFSYNDLGVDSIYISTVDSCTFHHNFYGVKYSNGTLIRNCIFQNNSEIALTGKYGSLFGNSFLYNNIALQYSLAESVLIYLPTQIFNNRFEQNIIGFRISGEIPTGKFENNFLCNNSLYSVFNSTVHNPNLSKNCWCGQDSLQIRNKIFDLYTDVSRKAGIVNFAPFSKSCRQFFPKHSITGQSVSSSKLHKVWLYKSEQGTEQLISNIITTAKFTFNNLEEGTYKLLSIALNTDSSDNNVFRPTYYFKKLSLSKAEPLILDSDIFDVDIEMIPISRSLPSSTSFFEIETDSASEFLVLLEDGNGLSNWKNVNSKTNFSFPLNAGKYKITLIGRSGEFSSSFYDLLESKSYKITLTNNIVTVNAVLGIESVTDTFKDRIKVYPSIIDEEINISSEFQLRGALISVFNSTGSKVIEFGMDGAQNKINTTKWPAGFYILKIIHNSAKFTFTLIKN